MKKYTTLSTDCTALAAEYMTYLNSAFDVEDSEHHQHAFHLVDAAFVSGSSINTTFAGLTAKVVAHITINSNAMFNHCYDTPFMIIPLADCASTVFKTFDVAPGAVLQPDLNYLDADCTLSATVPLTGPILVNASTTYTMESSDTTKLSDVLVVWFNEDPSSLLA
jgi:hypothetical protein